ncbi:MAG TPA: long-chain fatty acid--CoA ligase [Syntrophales bacterium]|nr:long-chain fatty acid--CoA ligase [Syntrophales bacterium]
MSDTHLARMVHNQAARYGTKTALRYKSGDHWHDLSYRSLGELIRTAAKALLELGVRKGEMVGIYSGNRPEWTIADFAILSAGAVSVPIYATSTAGQAGYIVHDADIRIAFAGNQTQYDRITGIPEQSSNPAVVVVFDEGVDLRGNTRGISWRDFLEKGRASARDAELDERLQRASTDDLATLIYTSGTTGEPKGVMLHHSNFHHSFIAHDRRLNVSDRDVSLCFLPLAHVYERAWSYYVIGHGMMNAYVDDMSKVIDYLREIKPTIMCAVPRFYEKIYMSVFEKLDADEPWRKKLFLWALGVGEAVYLRRKEKRLLTPVLRLQWLAAEALVLKKLQGVVGGRIRFLPCAGAPLARKIEEFFHSAGIRITYGYGLTETTATVTCHEDHHFRPGTVGKPIDGVEVKIAPSGEILVRGKTVMSGYYRKPEATAEAFEDGWLKTGDVGVLEDGYLTITDRIKELMKTSGGKYIAPQYVESTLAGDPYIEQLIVIADGRPYATALIVPAFDALEAYAKTWNIATSSREELVRDPILVRFFEGRIEARQKDLAGYEKVKRIALLPRPFSQEAGEMTPTLKVRRRVIIEKYHDLIDAMYAREKEATTPASESDLAFSAP